MRRLAHGIRGAGGTYGFPGLSETARRVELAPAEELRGEAVVLLDELEQLTADTTVQPTRVLLIEGSDDDAVALSEALASPLRKVHRVRTASAATALLRDERFDLIVLDVVLPDLDGRSLLLRLGEQVRTSSVPVTVVAAEPHAPLQAECYRLGAQQFFPKPVDASVLTAASEAAIERAEKMHRVSTIDPLTGIPNRAGFHETLQLAVSMCSRSNESLSVAVIDLDRFKSINDTYGHPTGDDVLRRVAAILKERTRKSDYVARWGGEEFVALLYGSASEGATLAVERFRKRVREETFRAPDGTEFHVTLSAGVAQVDVDGNPGEAIAEADRLLFSAKEMGRDRTVNAKTADTTIVPTVLLVEDDALVAEAVSQTLGEHGYEVTHLTNSEAVLEIEDDRHFSLGILDVNMPGMDGPTTLRELQRDPELAAIPVVFMTAKVQPQERKRYEELGAIGVVAKPFDPAALPTTLRDLWNNAAQPTG